MLHEIYAIFFRAIGGHHMYQTVEFEGQVPGNKFLCEKVRQRSCLFFDMSLDGPAP